MESRAQWTTWWTCYTSLWWSPHHSHNTLVFSSSSLCCLLPQATSCTSCMRERLRGNSASIHEPHVRDTKVQILKLMYVTHVASPDNSFHISISSLLSLCHSSVFSHSTPAVVTHSTTLWLLMKAPASLWTFMKAVVFSHRGKVLWF